MDCMKVGQLIRQLRSEKQLTQKQLANALNISDKTVSKWERGWGCPDISLVVRLSDLLGVNAEELLAGDLPANHFVNGNMKNSSYCVCPVCGNVTVSTGNAQISCCGKKLAPCVPQKPDKDHALTVEIAEDEWFVSSGHDMTKTHFVSFVALVTGDRLYFFKQYPEWNLQVRIPKRGHGRLLWYCSRHGLFYQLI